ncbi:MAG: LacI family DNA-binding transcriptional regulator [Melioribacteraceae bacterium]|nr:LacI family DNA-binding transcriptional regulator [Melioribacteraceae bacterium]
MTEKSVTLNDIAKRLNYSTVTISKALRNHPDISPQTTKLIKSVAEEMGYTPNIMARNLSARRSNTIGVVVPKIAHFFFSAIIESIYDYAFNHNYEIILTVSQENAEREKRHIQTLLAMKVDGIIVSISQETKNYEIFETVRRRGVPLVFMDRIPAIENINTVQVNDREGAFKAIEHAIKLGYRNIAHFAGYSDINIGRERYYGFKDAMDQYNIPIKPEWVVAGEFGENHGYDGLMELHRQNNLPDLIFTVTYPVALGVYMAARELNLKIPDDIDVICFGNAKVQNFLSPPLSCVDQPTNLLASESMEILLENINSADGFEPRNIQIPTELILRGTCRKFNKE